MPRANCKPSTQVRRKPGHCARNAQSPQPLATTLSRTSNQKKEKSKRRRRGPCVQICRIALISTQSLVLRLSPPIPELKLENVTAAVLHVSPKPPNAELTKSNTFLPNGQHVKQLTCFPSASCCQDSCLEGPPGQTPSLICQGRK